MVLIITIYFFDDAIAYKTYIPLSHKRYESGMIDMEFI